MIDTRTELEHALWRDPEDRALRLVYADALVEAGEPHGELIVLAHQIADGVATREQRCRERELRRSIESELFAITTTSENDRTRRLTRLVWRDGFIDRIDVDLGIPAAFDRLARLLARRELRWLRAIDLRPGWSRRDREVDCLARLGELLCGMPIRWLGVGARHEPLELDALSALRAQLPRLRGLALSRSNPEIAPILDLGLDDLELVGHERGAYAESALAELFAAPRALERLVLGGDPDVAVLAALAPIFDGSACRSVRQFGLMGGDDAFDEAFIDRLAGAPLLSQLDSVGLTVHRNATSNTKLVEHAERFTRVRWFTQPRYDGGWEWAWHDLAHLYETLGRTSEALAEFDALLTLVDDATYWVDVGMQLTALGDHEEAIVAHDRARAIDPKNGRAWSGRASALQALGRHEDAVVSWDAGQAAGLADVHTWSNRAYALMQLERYDEALAALDAALAIDPEHAWSKTNRASVAAKLRAPRRLARAVRKWFSRAPRS